MQRRKPAVPNGAKPKCCRTEHVPQETRIHFVITRRGESAQRRARLRQSVLLRWALDANLRRVGGITYDERELAFARAIHKSFPPDALAIGTESKISEFQEYRTGGSTDVGDVRWRVPSAGLRTATWVPGTASQSWQAGAAGGTSSGIRA